MFVFHLNEHFVVFRSVSVVNFHKTSLKNSLVHSLFTFWCFLLPIDFKNCLKRLEWVFKIRIRRFPPKIVIVVNKDFYFIQMSSKQTSGKDDDRYETEEYLVYVDLDTKLLDDQLSKSNAKIKFLGIDTENPIMQLNNQLFKGNSQRHPSQIKMVLLIQNDFYHLGSYEYSMGTHCFFTESKRPGDAEDACFEELPKKKYDYFVKTNKVLKLKRIFVDEKEETASSTELAEGEIENLEHLRISKTYADALNQFLKPGEKPPRDIAPDAQDNEDDVGPEMEVDKIVENQQNDEGRTPNEESQNDEPSEDSETKLESEVHEVIDRLIDPDYEPRS